MKVMIDTNIFISAALFPNGRAASAFLKALVPPYQPLTCDYVVDDRAILRAALSAKAELLLTGDKDFLEAAVEGLRVISVSDFLAL